MTVGIEAFVGLGHNFNGSVILPSAVCTSRAQCGLYLLVLVVLPWRGDIAISCLYL